MSSTVNDTTLRFFNWVTKSGLDIQRLAAVRCPSTTVDDLRTTVERKLAGN